MADLFRRVCVGFVLLAAGAAGASAQERREAPPLPSGPMTLEQVLQLAEARSEAIAIARAGVQRAEGDQVRARSGLFPQLSVSASYDRALASEFSDVFGSDTAPPCPPFALNPSAGLDTRVAEIERAIDCGAIGNAFFGGDADVDLPFGRENTWRANILFSQSIWSGGRIAAQEAAATAARHNAELAVNAARAQLLFDVTQAFYDAALSERLVRIAEATLAQAEATVTQARAQFDAGAQPEFELLRAQVTRDNQRPAVIRQQADRDVAMLRLKQLLDLPADYDLALVAPLDGTVPPPAPFAERVAQFEQPGVAPDLADRNAVREIESVVSLREASLRSALAERWPSISVTSSYGRVAYPSGAFPTGDFLTNWTVGAAIDLPILTGGRLRGAEISARAELEESRLQLQQVRELAQLDASSAMAELTAARATLAASAGTVEQASRAYQIAEVRYRAGVSTQLELSDARLQLQQAEANRAQAARDLQVARVRVALLGDLPIGSLPAGTLRAVLPLGTQQQSGAQGGGATGTAGIPTLARRPGGGNQ
jgi:outer membrane protein TolC